MENNLNKRKAGILMPIFSLPGKYGVGTLGKEARRFADFLAEAGQSYWQILPIGPTGYGDSPYQSFSTFAGNPYFIDLEILCEEGLLTKEECDAMDFGSDPRRVSYDRLFFDRFPLLESAYGRFQKNEDYEKFLKEQGFWLGDYARFMEEKCRRPADFYCFLQYEFFKQWESFRRYVNEKGIEIIGDIPIYVAPDSSDVKKDPELFQTDGLGRFSAVAGCPPDAFAADGQLWGNPLYDWDMHKAQGFRWWIDRMRQCFRLFDVVRVDHFRGFDEYYSIPAGSKTAKGGHWEKGPGMALFDALQEALGPQKIIAEDLGYVTDSVRRLVKDTGFPGMKLMQFAYDSREAGDYRPETWPENCVAYTGTHDNQTMKDWYLELTKADQENAAEALGTTREALLQEDYVGKFIQLTMQSVANTVIIPMQDYKRFGREARINQPSTLGKNWTFRFTEADFDAKLAEEIRRFTEESGRCRKTES